MMMYFAAVISGFLSAISLIADYVGSPIFSTITGLIALILYAVFVVWATKATRVLSCK